MVKTRVRKGDRRSAKASGGAVYEGRDERARWKGKRRLPDRRRTGQENGARREGGVGLSRAARGKESRRWASPAARGSVGGDTGE